MSELTGSEAGTGPSLAQGSTGPPEEEEVLGGTGGPQGSALGGVTATREEGRCRGGLTQHIAHTTHTNGCGGVGWGGWKLGSSFSAPPSQLKPTERGGGGSRAALTALTSVV